MLLNRNVIQTSVLSRTLIEEIERLNSLCSGYAMNQLEKRVQQLERDLCYLHYDYSQKVERRESHRAHQEQRYANLFEEKQVWDEELTNSMIENQEQLRVLTIKRNQLKQAKAQEQAQRYQENQLSEKEIKIVHRGAQLRQKIENELRSLTKLQKLKELKGKEKQQLADHVNALDSQINIDKIIIETSKRANEQIGLAMREDMMLMEKFCKEYQQDKLLLERQIKQTATDYQLTTKKVKHKMKNVAELEKQVQICQQKHQQVQKSVLRLQSDHKNAEAKLVQVLKLTENIGAQRFQNKLTMTSQRVQFDENIPKLRRLKEIKQEMLELIAPY